MPTIHVRRETPASPEALFARLSDPATYQKVPGVKLAELVRPGRETQFGVGAVRRIRIGSFLFEEEITHSEPGVRLDYLVIASQPRIEHRGGIIELTRTPQGCVVDWYSTFRIPVLVLGPLLGMLGERRMKRAFDDAIRVAAELAQGS